MNLKGRFSLPFTDIDNRQWANAQLRRGANNDLPYKKTNTQASFTVSFQQAKQLIRLLNTENTFWLIAKAL